MNVNVLQITANGSNPRETGPHFLHYLVNLVPSVYWPDRMQDRYQKYYLVTGLGFFDV